MRQAQAYKDSKNQLHLSFRLQTTNLASTVEEGKEEGE